MYKLWNQVVWVLALPLSINKSVQWDKNSYFVGLFQKSEKKLRIVARTTKGFLCPQHCAECMHTAPHRVCVWHRVMMR